MGFMSRVETALRQRRAYARTVRALRSLPADTAADLNIRMDEADAIARRAVYGK